MSLPRVLKDIYDLKNGQLTGKYYTPTISVNPDNDPLEYTVNPVPTTWTTVPNEVSKYVNGEYSIESNVGHNSTSNLLSAAFDNSTSSYFRSSTVLKLDITLTLPAAIRVNKIKYRISLDSTLEGLIILGSNNKTSWSELYVDNNPNVLNLAERSLTSTDFYKYYRLTCNATANSFISVYEFQISSYNITTYTAKLSLEDIPTPLNMNQRIMIKVPEYDPTGVTSMTLNSIRIDAILLPHRYYELIYDGARYLTKEVV